MIVGSFGRRLVLRRSRRGSEFVSRMYHTAVSGAVTKRYDGTTVDRLDGQLVLQRFLCASIQDHCFPWPILLCSRGSYKGRISAPIHCTLKSTQRLDFHRGYLCLFRRGISITK